MDEIKETDNPYGVGYKCVLHDSQGRVVGVCDGWADKTEPKARTWNKNTVMKMAQKRAFVGATLYACNASAIFTQDEEDYGADEPPTKRTEEVTKRQTPADAGAELFIDLVITVNKEFESEVEATEFVKDMCRNAGLTSTDDLVDPINLQAVRSRMWDGIEAKNKPDPLVKPDPIRNDIQDEGPVEVDESGSLVLRRLVQEYGTALNIEPMWECIKAAGFNTVSDLAEEGAYEMCVTYIEERIEDDKKRATVPEPPIEPGDASKSVSKPRARTPRSKTTKGATEDK